MTFILVMAILKHFAIKEYNDLLSYQKMKKEVHHYSEPLSNFKRF